jgi:hypothetical protein
MKPEVPLPCSQDLPLVPILSQMNPVCTFLPYFCENYYVRKKEENNSTRHHNPEDLDLNLHRRESLKTDTV